MKSKYPDSLITIQEFCELMEVLYCSNVNELLPGVKYDRVVSQYDRQKGMATGITLNNLEGS